MSFLTILLSIISIFYVFLYILCIVKCNALVCMPDVKMWVCRWEWPWDAMPVCMGMAVVWEKCRSVCARECGRMNGMQCLLCMGMAVVWEKCRSVCARECGWMDGMQCLLCMGMTVVCEICRSVYVVEVWKICERNGNIGAHIICVKY